MLTKTDLNSLQDYERFAGRTLSIYLDTDQGNAANLNRGFETALQADLKLAENKFEEGSDRRNFQVCAARAIDFVSKYAPHARGLVLFSNTMGSLWARELNVPTKTEVHWNDAAYLEPLAGALNEYQRYALIVGSRSHAKIYTMMMGRLEQRYDVHAKGRVRHVKGVGMDHLYSQAGIQRKADERVHSHLLHVCELLEHLAVEAPFERLVLAGTTEVTSELFQILPKWLRSRVAGSLTLSIDAPNSDLLTAVNELEQRVERQTEFDRAVELIDAAGHKAKATVGIAATVKALNEKRVRELVFSENHTLRGGHCKVCDAVYSEATTVCEYCGTSVAAIDDLIHLAAARALLDGARIAQVRNEAAAHLNVSGGVGAFLRY
jgi:peptide subunit release factor 1 (eRF1)